MKYLIITLIIFCGASLQAQNVNWNSKIENRKDITYVNMGYDFSINTQIGYGHYIDIFRPMLISLDYSFPMGEDVFDDFKTRLGVQMPIYRKGDFVFSGKLYGLFRRHQTKLVRMASFGSEMTAIAGYYKPTWHLAGEFGFDKSINTHLKHSVIMQENNPNITDGWFIPSGGNFYYGIQGSKSVGSNIELTMRAGVTNAQFKDENSLLPYYAQIGINCSIFHKSKIE